VRREKEKEDEEGRYRGDVVKKLKIREVDKTSKAGYVS